uniref:Uncharacterized protein n=1 Tax=Anguilla anguilla TaxID=7936 RepID=A0A0E9UE11_ANGAN
MHCSYNFPPFFNMNLSRTTKLNAILNVILYGSIKECSIFLLLVFYK